MKRLITASVLLLASMLTSTCLSAEEVKLTPTEQTMLDNVNEARRQHGLSPLVVDHVLQVATRQHASWMCKTRSMTHAANVCENIAMGQGTCWHVHTTWMNNSGHRANILRSGMTKLGVAAYMMSGGRVYYCMRVSR